MKHSKVFKPIFFLLVLFLVLSCKSDDDTLDQTTDLELIGAWQRSDFSEDFEYVIIFNTDNTGFTTQLEGNSGSGQISTARSFDWITIDTILNINYDDEAITTNYSINAQGQLLLSDLTDLNFNRID